MLTEIKKKDIGQVGRGLVNSLFCLLDGKNCLYSSTGSSVFIDLDEIRYQDEENSNELYDSLMKLMNDSGIDVSDFKEASLLEYCL